MSDWSDRQDMPNIPNRMTTNTLLEATVTLYPAGGTGAPNLATAIWMGTVVENFSVRGEWIKEETRPSGARYPRRHPLVAQYLINLGRVWVDDSTQAEFAPGAVEYVLDVVWVDDDTQNWRRQTFYGVTVGEQGWEARDVESGLVENQGFAAQYFVSARGTGTPPAISADLPLWVQYVSTGETTPLYSYDPATRLFTALTTTVGRAELGYAGGDFALTFAGASAPVMLTRGAALVVNGDLNEGVVQGLPRLEFYAGQRRMFGVTPSALYAFDYAEAAPLTSVPAGGFGFNSGGVLTAVAVPGRITALGLGRIVPLTDESGFSLTTADGVAIEII